MTMRGLRRKIREGEGVREEEQEQEQEQEEQDEDQRQNEFGIKKKTYVRFL
jgi:hypothetical protein